MKEFGWSTPTPQAVSTIKEFVGDRRLLEVGAGHGLWAYLLSEAGVDVVATDDFSWQQPGSGAGFSVPVGRFFAVESLSAANAVRKYNDRKVLLLSWPPPDRPMAYDALAAFAGDRLVYIGDRKATADDLFRNEIHTGWNATNALPLPCWPGLHDAVYLYVRKAAAWQPGSSGLRPNPHRL